MNQKIISTIGIVFFLASNSNLQASCPVLVQSPGSPYAAGFAAAVAYSPNGNYLAVTQAPNVTIYSVNNSTGALVVSSSTATSGLVFPSEIAWSPNGLFGAVIDADAAQVKAFTINDATGVWTPGTITPLSVVADGVAYSPDSRFAAIIAENDVAHGLGIYSVNQSTGTLTLVANYATALHSGGGVAYSPNGDFIAATTSTGVYLFSVNSSTGLLTPVVGSPVTVTLNSPDGVAYSPDSRFAAVGNGGTGTVSVFAVNNAGLFVNTVPGSPYATGGVGAGAVAYSPDGNFAAVGLANDQIAVYSVNQATGVFTPLADSPFTLSGAIDAASLQFSPNSTFIAVVNEQGAPPNNTVSMVKLFGLPGQTVALDFVTIDAFGRVTAVGYGAQPGSTITIYANCNTVIGTGTANALGNFMITASTLLPKNIYGITATETLSGCTTQPSNQIIVGGTLSFFIQRLINKYSNC